MGSFTSLVWAHEDPEKITAAREAHHLMQAEQQKQRDFALQRSVAQSYVATSQGWTVELQIFPDLGENSHEVRLFLLAPHQLHDVDSASLLQMSTGKKAVFNPHKDYFMSNTLRFSQQQSGTLMLKLKTTSKQYLFFKFMH